MKIQIEIDYEIDGEQPDTQDVINLLEKRILSCLLSEEIGKPDLWALLPQGCEVRILPDEETPSQPAKTAEQFYRELLEQITQDPRRTRARRLAESGLLFWDSVNEEAARTYAANKTAAKAEGEGI